MKIFLCIACGLLLLAGCKGTVRDSSAPVTAEKSSLASVGAETGQTGYLHTGNENATFIQWTKIDRQIKGQLQAFNLHQDGKTDSSGASFEGVFDSNNVSLTFRDKYLTFIEGRTVTGTLKGDSLALVWPQKDGTLWTQTYLPASVADYNNAVRQFQGRAREILAAREEAGRQAQAARVEADRINSEQRAVVNAHNAVTDADDELKRAVEDLPTDESFSDEMKRFASVWREMQTQYAALKERAARPLTDVQIGQLEVAVGTLETRKGTIEVARGSLDGDLSRANDRIKDTNARIAGLQTAWEGLQRAVAANTTGTPQARITAEQITKAVEFARSKLNKAVNAKDAAQRQATVYDKQAADLCVEARKLVRSLRPSKEN